MLLAGDNVMKEITARLDAFCQAEGLTGAFTATRSGNFICGILPEGQHRDTFVAMTAIIHGGAETTAMEMKKQLDHITVNFSDGKMVVINLGTKAILAILGPRIDDPLVAKTKALVKDLEGLIQ